MMDISEASFIAADVASPVFRKRVPALFRRIRAGELMDNLIEDYNLRGRRSVVQSMRRINKNLPYFGAVRAADLGTCNLKT